MILSNLGKISAPAINPQHIYELCFIAPPEPVNVAVTSPAPFPAEAFGGQTLGMKTFMFNLWKKEKNFIM